MHTFDRIEVALRILGELARISSHHVALIVQLLLSFHAEATSCLLTLSLATSAFLRLTLYLIIILGLHKICRKEITYYIRSAYILGRKAISIGKKITWGHHMVVPLYLVLLNHDVRILDDKVVVGSYVEFQHLRCLFHVNFLILRLFVPLCSHLFMLLPICHVLSS